MKRLMLSLLLCIGCNGGGGGSDAEVPFGAGASSIANPNAPVDEDAVEQYARDWCTFYQRCGFSFYPSAELCIDVFSCSARDYGAFTSLTRGELLACSRSVAGRDCSSVSPIAGECIELSRVLTDALRIDLSCGGETCDDASWCDDRNEACPRCVPLAALGEPCLGTLCADGSFCNTTTLECEPQRAEGMACERTSECQSFSVNSRAWLACRNEVCAKPAAAGEACVDQADCSVFQRCHNGACSDRAPAGEACSSTLDCNPNTQCIQGTCVEACGIQRVGEPCTYDGLCLDSFCDDVTSSCAPLKAAGTACADSDECADGLFCNTSRATCAPRAPDGTACGLNDECMSSLCSNQVCAQSICEP